MTLSLILIVLTNTNTNYMYINSSEGALVFVIVIFFFLFFDIKRERAEERLHKTKQVEGVRLDCKWAQLAFGLCCFSQRDKMHIAVQKRVNDEHTCIHTCMHKHTHTLMRIHTRTHSYRYTHAPSTSGWNHQNINHYKMSFGKLWNK